MPPFKEPRGKCRSGTLFFVKKQTEESMSLTAWTKHSIFVFIAILLTALAVELLSYGFAMLYLEPRYGWVFLRLRYEDLGKYDVYMKRRHPVLGWPLSRGSKGYGLINEGRYDATGARPSPFFASSERAYVALYGDSFTYGWEVDDAHTWGDVLARRLGRRVANYGVAGYGTDQACLRFKLNERDSSQIVILGIWPENIMRNLTQYRGFLGSEFFSLKPRFMIDRGGKLALVPLPTLTKQQFQHIVARARAYLPLKRKLPTTSAPLSESMKES